MYRHVCDQKHPAPVDEARRLLPECRCVRDQGIGTQAVAVQLNANDQLIASKEMTLEECDGSFRVIRS